MNGRIALLRAVDCLLGSAAGFLAAFGLMLVIGVAHSQDDRVPAFGFVVSMCLVSAGFLVLLTERFIESLRKEPS